MRKIAMFPRGARRSCRGWDFAAERSDAKSHGPRLAGGVRHPPPITTRAEIRVAISCVVFCVVQATHDPAIMCSGDLLQPRGSKRDSSLQEPAPGGTESTPASVRRRWECPDQRQAARPLQTNSRHVLRRLTGRRGCDDSGRERREGRTGREGRHVCRARQPQGVGLRLGKEHVNHILEKADTINGTQTVAIVLKKQFPRL